MSHTSLTVAKLFSFFCCKEINNKDNLHACTGQYLNWHRLTFLFFFFLSPEEGEYFLKVLIPSYAAGSIIGKGGQTIVQLQKETGATIKLSKSKDFYPGKSADVKKSFILGSRPAVFCWIVHILSGPVGKTHRHYLFSL